MHVHVLHLNALKLPETQAEYFAFCCIAFPDTDDKLRSGIKKPEIKTWKVQNSGKTLGHGLISHLEHIHADVYIVNAFCVVY